MHRTMRPLGLVHADVSGPFPVQRPHGKLYFVVFVDNYTNTVDVQLLATKDQALEAWQLGKLRWENKLGVKVLVFHSDNGGEFINTAFLRVLDDCGVEWQLSALYAY